MLHLKPCKYCEQLPKITTMSIVDDGYIAYCVCPKCDYCVSTSHTSFGCAGTYDSRAEARKVVKILWNVCNEKDITDFDRGYVSRTPHLNYIRTYNLKINDLENNNECK